MARVKVDLKFLAEQERKARERLALLKKQQRLVARQEREERIHTVGELAEKFDILRLPDKVLVAEFERIAAAHPVPVDSAETGNSDHSTESSGTSEKTVENNGADEGDEPVPEPKKHSFLGR